VHVLVLTIEWSEDQLVLHRPPFAETYVPIYCLIHIISVFNRVFKFESPKLKLCKNERNNKVW